MRAAGLTIERRWSAAVILPAPDLDPGVLLATLHGHGIPAVREDGRVLALVAEDQLWKLPPAPTLTALATPCAAWAEVGHRIHTACAVADAAAREARSGIVESARYPLEELLASQPDLAERARRHVIDPLTGPAARGADLVATLAAFLDAGMDRRRVAEEQHLHPNSVGHRLKRIHEATGLDPADPDGLVGLVLGVAAHRLAAAGPAGI